MESHEADLRSEINDDRVARNFPDDYRGAGLDSATVELLDFAAKVTKTPSLVRRDDVERLRRCGFADEAILEGAQIVSYFNYSNRLMDCLGITPDPGMRYEPRD